MVTVHPMYVAFDPSKKAPTLYEMIPGQVPPEAMREWKLLNSWYESDHHGAFFSKSEMERDFRHALEDDRIPLLEHVAVSKRSKDRPKLYPCLTEHYPVVRELFKKAPTRRSCRPSPFMSPVAETE